MKPATGLLLVVDDEAFARDAVAATLRFLGSEVTTGERALSLAHEWPFDLVALDVMLPDADGFEVLHRLRRRGHRLPVMFLTARDAEADKVTGLTIGGDGHLTKPFDLDELAVRILGVGRRARPAETGPVHTFVDLELDQDSHPVHRASRPLDLSPTEFRLLRLPHAPSRPGVDPRTAARRRVGLRLRWVQHRRVHRSRLPAPHRDPVRRRSDAYSTRRRIQPASTPQWGGSGGLDER